MELKELGIRMTARACGTAEERLVDERDERMCEELDGRFRQRRRELGPVEAAEQWFAPVLATWRAWIDDEAFDELDCDARDLCELAVTLTDSLAMRDALVMALLVEPDGWDERTITEFAVHPHSRASGEGMGALLTSAFDDPRARPDVARVERGIAVLDRCAQIVPDAYRAQPLATAAYACWWIGDAHAMPYAMEAVSLDDDATLAGIVVAAILRGVCPAWVHADADADDAGVERRG